MASASWLTRSTLRLLDFFISLIPAPKKSPGVLHPDMVQAIRVARSGFFDEGYYLSQATSENPVNAYSPLHYIRRGTELGFEPCPGFNRSVYLQSIGASASDKNPLIAYLDQQEAEQSEFAGERESTGQSPSCAILFNPQNKQFFFEEGRAAYVLAMHFAQKGCRVFIPKSSDIYRYQKRYRFFKKMVTAPWVQILADSAAAPGDALELQDNFKEDPGFKGLLWMRDQPDSNRVAFIQPYSMHPNMYEMGFSRNLRWLRGRKRRTRLFFSGDAGWKFKLNLVRLLHGKVPRHEMLAEIRKGFSEYLDQRHFTADAFINREADAPPLVILDGRTTRFPAVRWLEVLGTASFYLGAAGGYSPLSHNIIEAMSVGTIPVLEHGNYFCPELEDGVNCIRFSGTKGLAQAVRRVLDMPEKDISEMRTQVIDYYDAYLDFGRFVDRLLISQAGVRPVYFPYEVRLAEGWTQRVQSPQL